MKPFDLKKYEKGYSICTVGGHRARILCTDRKDFINNIVALVETDPILELERVLEYSDDGICYNKNSGSKIYDLMLLEEKEGWIAIYPINHSEFLARVGKIYDKKSDVLKEIDKKCRESDTPIQAKILKISWKE